MKLSAFKAHLTEVDILRFIVSGGDSVPLHFHITEAGLTTKHFIDCGGTERFETHATFQIWVAGDADHRLVPGKLGGIIDKAKTIFSDEDPEVEIEYQNETIGRYGLDFQENCFVLVAKHTDCLAPDLCRFPKEKVRVGLSALGKQKSCCDPEDGCC